MAKVNGLDIVRIPINGKNTLRVMRNGKELWNWTGLPSGYNLLEYIQSNGSQYIDTGFKPNNNTRVVMDVQLTSTVAPQFIFGIRPTASSLYTVLMTDSKFRSDYGSSEVQSSIPSVLTNRIIIDKNKNLFYVDGVLGATNSSSSFSCSDNLQLCATKDWGSSTATYLSSMKIYSCKIYDNGVLVRDYVPCKNPSGVCGLYDKVNNVFYGSASGTPFTGA